MTVANGDSDNGRWISTNQPYARHSVQHVARRRAALLPVHRVRPARQYRAIAIPLWRIESAGMTSTAATWSYSQFASNQTPWAFYSAAVLDPVSGKISSLACTSNIGPGYIWLYDPSAIRSSPVRPFPQRSDMHTTSSISRRMTAFTCLQTDGRVWRMQSQSQRVSSLVDGDRACRVTGQPPAQHPVWIRIRLA